MPRPAALRHSEDEVLVLPHLHRGRHRVQQDSGEPGPGRDLAARQEGDREVGQSLSSTLIARANKFVCDFITLRLLLVTLNLQ